MEGACIGPVVAVVEVVVDLVAAAAAAEAVQPSFVSLLLNYAFVAAVAGQLKLELDLMEAVVAAAVELCFVVAGHFVVVVDLIAAENWRHLNVTADGAEAVEAVHDLDAVVLGTIGLAVAVGSVVEADGLE
jgi:nitrogen regulatory protein PII-like uncharacterized protein